MISRRETIWSLVLVGLIFGRSAFAADGWKSEKPIGLDAKAFAGAALGPKPIADYVTLDFAYAPFETARVELEKRYSLALKNRGEAHVTVVTPPEFKILSKVLAPKEIRDSVAKDVALEKSEANPVCVGEGVVGEDHAWFIVLEMPALLQARREIQKRFEKKGGEKLAFKAEEFYPHVTLGFTKRDLHLQDGVVKDVTACRLPIRR